jgi:hypothetical protein
MRIINPHVGQVRFPYVFHPEKRRWMDAIWFLANLAIYYFPDLCGFLEEKLLTQSLNASFQRKRVDRIIKTKNHAEKCGLELCKEWIDKRP